MSKRTPEQVHEAGGHAESGVKSCSLCVPEVVLTPESYAHPGADRPQGQSKESRSECNVYGCARTPYYRGLCGAHWATRRGMASKEDDHVG